MKLNSEQLIVPDFLSQFSIIFDELPSDELPLIGQARASEGLSAGLQLKGRGTHIFITGSSGSGKKTLIKKLLGTPDQPLLTELYPESKTEYCFAYNFRNHSEPRLFTFTNYLGMDFKKEVEGFFPSVVERLPSLLADERFCLRLESYTEKCRLKEAALLGELEVALEEEGFMLIKKSDSSLNTVLAKKAVDGSEKPVFLEGVQQGVIEERLTKYEAQRLFKAFSKCQNIVEGTHQKIRNLDEEFRKKQSFLVVEAIEMACRDPLFRLCDLFPEEQYISYFKQIKEDIIRRVSPIAFTLKSGAVLPLPGCYRVNFLGQFDSKKFRVYQETAPDYENLFGTIENQSRREALDELGFLRIVPGSLVKSNGGICIIEASELLERPDLFNRFKQYLRHNEICIQRRPEATDDGFFLRPQPIPIDTKIILLGSESEYSQMKASEGFSSIFRTRVEFSDEIRITESTIRQLATYLKSYAVAKNLECSKSGFTAVLREGTLKVNSRKHFTADIASLLALFDRAALSLEGDNRCIDGSHIEYAVQADKRRESSAEDHYHESLKDDLLVLNLEGERVGEANVLTHLETGSIGFGFPTRLTATVSLGDEGFLNIEREVDLSGSAHSKGSFILESFLTSLLAREYPLPLSIYTCFEQTYSEVDGDSATLGECVAILSAISGIPLNQSFGITGSMTQKGEVQSIGAINEKIEGFYKSLKTKNLSKGGVIIPQANQISLVLSEGVMSSIKKGDFIIHTVSTIQEAIEILTGMAWKPTGEDKGFRDELFIAVESLQQKSRQQRN